jgi:hypothetical protein
MADGPRPYFLPLVVDGQGVAFDHLEPFQFGMASQVRPDGVVIDVRFSNHCFSETFDAARHAEPVVDVWDGPRRRVFCPVRYGQSVALPDLVRALPTAHVFQTPETNFVRIAGGDYRMFFRVKRAAVGENHHLKLFVESAYSPEAGQALAPAHMSKVRFAVLVDKTLRGEKLKFHHKR